MRKEHSLLIYVIRRLLLTIPIVIGIAILIFVMVRAAPGDPVYALGGEGITETQVNALRERWGLNKPLYEQLPIFLGGLFQGDLGYSYRYNAPVWDIIVSKVPATVLLAGTAVSIASVLGVILGVKAASKPFSKSDAVITTGSLIVFAQPIFWTGMIFIVVFSVTLGMFPTQGMVSGRVALYGIDYSIDVLHHLILPATVMALSVLAVITRITRASVLDVLRLDFVTTAVSKGLPERTILYRHVLRNALLPIVTVIGVQFGRVMGGAFLTETVFAWPGMGRLLFEAISLRDMPVISGIFLLVATSVLIANLITDILYAMIDPRVRY